MSDTHDSKKLPRTTRELLISEMLGDIDAALDKVAHVVELVDKTVGLVNASSDRYRDAVQEFTEQAKSEMIDAANRAFAKSREEQLDAMQEAARSAFRSEASDKAHDLARILRNILNDLEQSRLTRLKESAIIAVVSSLVTAMVLGVFFIRHI